MKKAALLITLFVVSIAVAMKDDVAKKDIVLTSEAQEEKTPKQAVIATVVGLYFTSPCGNLLGEEFTYTPKSQSMNLTGPKEGFHNNSY